NLVIGQSGKVQRIALTFNADDFSAIESAVIQKFGKPTDVETGEVENRMGAAFPQRTDVWGTSPSPTVRLSHYAATLDHGSLTFQSEEDRQMLERVDKGDPNDL
ncbi:MAG: hypothetical protein JSS21_02020, partial [Proteobacteria bacterium]|nr:hypothetical protein [Pseudomonadota bacterium]